MLKRFFLIFFLFTLVLSAEDRPDSMFEKNYVTKPQQTGNYDLFNAKPSPQDTNATPSENQPQLKSPSKMDLESGELTKGAMEVRWLGMIIDAQDEKHFAKELDRYLKHVQKYDLDTGLVKAIGVTFRTSELDQQIVQIMARGGYFEFTSTIPEKYGLSQSPAWLVGTENGIYVLEALRNPQQYFTMSGKFIDKS